MKKISNTCPLWQWETRQKFCTWAWQRCYIAACNLICYDTKRSNDIWKVWVSSKSMWPVNSWQDDKLQKIYDSLVCGWW